MHASDVELLRCSDPREPLSDEHIVGCASCTATVEALRRGRLAVLASVAAVDAPGPDCLDEHAIAAMAEGTVRAELRHAWVLHLSRCSACRRAVSSVALARSSEPVATEISAVDRRRPVRWLQVAAPIGAVASLLLLMRPPADDPALHRGSPTAGQVPSVIAPSGPTEVPRVLRWHAVSGADRYRVTLFGSDGGVLFETSSTDTIAAVPDDVELRGGDTYYWIVAARVGFDRWETSGLAEFSIPGGVR